MDELILFNTRNQHPTLLSIILYSSSILVISQIIFSLLSIAFNIYQSTEHEDILRYKNFYKKNISTYHMLASYLAISSLYAPISEEFIFKYLILKTLFIKILARTPFIANLIHALIFGSFHMYNSVLSFQGNLSTKLQSINAFIISLIGGHIYISSNSLLSCLLFHIFINTFISLIDIIKYSRFLLTKN